MEFEGSVAFAFGLTVFAGLATGIGSAIGFFAKRTNTTFLCVSLGFSAGVMIYVSLVEILPKARVALVDTMGFRWGNIWAVAAFFGGIIAMLIIDRLVPDAENPHEVKGVEQMSHAMVSDGHHHHGLYRTGLFMALAIGIHNFPEGLATFASALNDPSLGIAIAVAIAIHNIPEGIAVSVPVYYATGSRKKAFAWSFVSGLAEPAGALIGYGLLMPFFSPTLFGVLFGSVGGQSPLLQ